MSTSEHRHADGRRGVDPRLWLVAAFVLGVVITAAVAVALDRGSSEPSSQPSQVSDSGGSGPTARATTGKSARPSESSSRSPSAASSASPPADSVQHALMTQPLAQLQSGDRVVYQMAACRFRKWVLRMDVALIACPGEAAFQVRTAYLVPVEPGGD